jgi:O-methyltransferase domain
MGYSFQLPFAALYADPERLKYFLRAMSGISRPANVAIAQRFPWANYKTFVDVGTAQGDLPAQIALANLHLTGVGFDLPEVGPIFEENMAENRLADRVTFVGGNFFTGPLPNADVVLMGHILHAWALGEKKMLLQKAYEAVPEGGAVMIYDSISRVVTEFQLGIIQEGSESVPQLECVFTRFGPDTLG